MRSSHSPIDPVPVRRTAWAAWRIRAGSLSSSAAIVGLACWCSIAPSAHAQAPSTSPVSAVPAVRALPAMPVGAGSTSSQAGQPAAVIAPVSLTPAVGPAPTSTPARPSSGAGKTVPAKLEPDETAALNETLDAIAATVGQGRGDDANEPVRGVGTHDTALDALHRRCLGRTGDATGLLKALDAIDADKKNDDPRRYAARRAAAWVLRREGRGNDSVSRLDAALALFKTEDALLARAYALDALDRAAPAKDAYEGLAKVVRDPALSATIRLRLALLDASRADAAAKKSAGSARSTAATSAVALTPAATTMTATTVVVTGAALAPTASSSSAADGAPAAAMPAEPDSALYAFASGADVDRETKNRAAVVSALLGRPREAIRLYESSGEGADRFRQEVRLAEWALLADAPKEAQEHAWLARAAATLRRDRSYALTVLVEAHRADSSLGALIARFAAEPELDAESRNTWIDLLRETARVDEAMELFRRSAQGGFTPEMRRELLEMCRESGRDDELVATYGQLIAEEPDRIEWREGLSRHWLERGRRDEARAVWSTFVEADGGVKRRMSAASATRDLGLEDLARQYAESCLADPIGLMEARLFLFDLEARRGHADLALAQLDAFDRDVPADAPQRIQLAEAFERIGDKARAVKVLEGVRAVRGAENAEEDLEMRLAWLLTETGEDERALTMWRNLWGRVDSLSRRRQVEDRLMATASRLGVLADIAVELEQKLAHGRADDRDAALLVRLYGKVGDPMSAAEVLEEHMKNAGRDELSVLEEKARIYLGGKDYYHFEKIVRRLIDVDPEKRSDHLRQLAMSQLERGKPTEAREVLRRLAECENPTDAAEFEAGVLALAGLNDEAARTYRRGLAQHPERIDGYLLLGNALNGLKQTDRAIGMFQFLAETAERDDLFTVAIDGILNMRAKEPALRWARRVTLERIARRHDKMYLYQLYCDLSEELADTPGMLRALETSLAISGEQRSAVLRQLMDASQGKADNSYVVVNGVLQPRRSGGESQRRLAYGRRLIGLGDLVPPQVYLELGEAFLRNGEVSNASKTFSMARDVPDYAAFRRQVAESFESAGFAENALEVYERAMASESLDVGLLLKAAALHEQLGRDERARVLYASGIEVLLAQHALTGSKTKAKEPTELFSWVPKNTNDFERWFPAVENGFLATSNDEQRTTLAAAQRQLLQADLLELDRTPPAEGETRTLESCPRARHRAEFLRHLLLASGHLSDAGDVDVEVLRRFPSDESAFGAALDARTARGLKQAALTLLERAQVGAEVLAGARARLGIATEGGDTLAAARVTLPEVVAQLVPLLIDGDAKQLSLLLRRMKMGEARKEDLPYVQLLVSAATYLRDETSVATLTSYALRVLAQHAEDWDDTQRAVSLIERVRRVVSPAAFDVIVDGFVANVAQDDKRLQRFQYAISNLQEELGRPLMSADAVRKRLEESLPDGEYMLPEMVALVPTEARADLVQGVWNKVPASSRARIALELLTQGDTAPPAELARLYADLFDGGLDGVTEAESLTWSVRSLMDQTHVPNETKMHVLERVRRKWPDQVVYGLMHAALARKNGDATGALEAVRKLLPALPKDSNDYFVRTATEQLVEAFGDEHAEELLAELERCENEGGSSETLDDMMSEVLDRLGDSAKRRVVLDRALARSPEKPEVLRRVYQDAQRDGDTVRVLDLLERLVRFDTKNTSWRRQLVQRWRALEQPVRALAVQRAGEQPTPKKVVQEEGRRLTAANVVEVKKAVDEGRMDDARALYRRTWRRFESGDRMFRVYSFGGFGGAQLWPDSTVDAAKPREESRAGLDELERALAKAAEAETKQKEAESRRTVYEAVAELPFGEEELDRQVRALDPSEIQRSGALLHGLGLAQVKRHGEAEAQRIWTERLREGTASLVDRALLLDHLERHLKDSTGPDPSALAEIAAAVHPLDSGQLRALARIHAKRGDGERALRIYEWCATLATSQRWYYDDGGSISASELIREVRRELAGDTVERALTTILASADPGPDESARDDFEALVLETWLEQLGAAEAARRCAEIVGRVGDPLKGLHREAAGHAAWILSRTGDTAGALRCLEVALCKFEENQVRLDPKVRFNKEWLLRERGIGLDDVAKLLPADLGPDGDAAAWCRAVTDAVVEWHARGRISAGTAQSILGTAFLRLHGVGDAAGARACLERFEALPKRPRSLDLTFADAHRRLGDVARADEIEEALLAERRLPVARVHEIVARWRANLGDAQAFERAAPIAEWTLNERYVAQMIEMARALGLEAEVARWQATSDEAAAARKELETPKP